jgi:hypothetical protein
MQKQWKSRPENQMKENFGSVLKALPSKNVMVPVKGAKSAPKASAPKGVMKKSTKY